jgi:hypothetical protein
LTKGATEMTYRIFDYYKNEDFGTEHVFALLKGKHRSFLQLSFDWYPTSEFPYLAISFGANRLVDIMVCFWKVGFCVEIWGCNWKNLREKE